ncbi:hydroxymethylbilane synthase [Lacibacter cauensis]|uniref:Porphobilinogen deaminase n=2 Tax=Lacibacter cauensis TaxID=510947 RepID=A0A562SR33_9BACT|nr:hydroxymethylbilane synthase [Lacibacter cauensis]
MAVTILKPSMSLLLPAQNKMGKIIRIGTRESELAVWQATQVKQLLAQHGYEAELVYIKSEGDIDLNTPLYEMGVQGVFTRSLDSALLNNKIDIAVHSMKDVPTQLPKGILQAAVLKRGPVKDLLVWKGEWEELSTRLGFVNGEWSMVNEDASTIGNTLTTHHLPLTIATSSIRRKAQWLHRYPNSAVENLRGNVNTRLRKLKEENWDAAIFAAAGLQRINLRPENSIELDWMLPAPAQGAIMVVCREEDDYALDACVQFNDADTAFCTKIEREFLRALLGGCSTPISAYAEVIDEEIHFRGNIFSLDGKQKAEYENTVSIPEAAHLGLEAAEEILMHGGKAIADSIKHAGK